MITRGELRLAGFVPQQDLPLLYAGALAFAYPSIYEGFGMPLAEAMATGTPVLTSDRTSLPEVVADAGICIDPQDSEQWSKELCRLVEDKVLREKLKQAGLERSQAFSWKEAARITSCVYHSLVD